MKTKLENKCGYYKISRNLLDKNIIETAEAREHYQRIGCYKCGGHDELCKIYFNPLKEYERGLNGNK